MVQKAIIALVFFITCSTAQAQLVEVPTVVKDAFEKQYNSAEQVDYDNLLASIHVHFTLNGEKMTAKYTNKGTWKETEKEWNVDSIPAAVKDGFAKSKFAEWKIGTAAVIYLPGGAEQYRIRAEKSELQKRFLYFNKEGRLLRDSMSL